MKTKEIMNRDANIAQTIDKMMEEMLAPISKKKDNMTDQERYDEIRAGLSGRFLNIFDMLWEKAKSGERTKNASPDTVLKEAKLVFRQWFMSKMEQNAEQKMQSAYKRAAIAEYRERYSKYPGYDDMQVGFAFRFSGIDPRELLKLPPKKLTAYLDDKNKKKSVPETDSDKFPPFPTYEEWSAEREQEEKEKAEKERLHQPVIAAYEYMHGSFSSFPFEDMLGAHYILKYADDPENALLDLPPSKLAAIYREVCQEIGAPHISLVSLEDVTQGDGKKKEDTGE